MVGINNARTENVIKTVETSRSYSKETNPKQHRVNATRLSIKSSGLAMMQWHFRTLTRGAREAVTIKTWPALAGEGSLRIVAHSFLMASA